MDYRSINATSFIPNYTDSNNSFNHNNSSNNTFQNSTSSPNSFEESFCWRYYGTMKLFTITFISIWGLLSLLAIYCLYSQIRSDHVVPVFIINLLISDIIQICCMIVQVANVKGYFINYFVIYYLYNCGVMASVFFMTSIAMERYLLIAWPFWYRFQRKLKVSASVSVVSWILSVFIGLNDGNWLGSLLVLPIPLLIFFLVRSIKALSTAQNVPPDERRQIIVVLTVVLFVYVLTFLPQIIMEFMLWGGWWWWDFNYTTFVNLISVSCTLIQLNPVADLLLYLIIKKWLFDKLLAFLCCCRKINNRNQQTNSITATTCSWSASQGQKEAENNS
ncbi:mas-related G-protein coupled receptor member X2-like [Xiphophorus hellerii]|uniref:mas-related G-protein coupled receptor member X2-like n=1 Tax=Xiphophorus hellerii TaxID=8084 RepID=UPI0013B35807|nr:mas-related G-protein coupled receptor member X2-like [Xiphophorus hellerii]XP_032408562.1 mas-related G-protein coupled receptor member X2-like [Xiphophorus hellerii]